MKILWQYFVLGVVLTFVPVTIYAASGSQASDSEVLSITIETKEAEITPSPTPVVTNTPTPVPIKTNIPTLLPSATPIPTPTPTIQPTPIAQAPSPADLENFFARYANEYGVDINMLKRIADCESHFNPAAINGPYGGMYQYTVTSWASKRIEMGLDVNPELRFNAEESIRTAAYTILHYGVGIWPSCSN